MNYKVFFISLYLFTNCFSQSKVQNISLQNIPKHLVYKGNFVKGITWQTVKGKNTFIITEQKEGETLTKNWKSILRATLFTNTGAITQKPIELVDSAMDNTSDFQFIEGTLNTNDIDKDGNLELSFIYEITHEGDPLDVVYIIIYKEKQFKITASIPVGYDENSDCEMDIGKSLQNLPAQIQEYAKNEYITYLKTKHSCFFQK